jgi:hypothetical protein
MTKTEVMTIRAYPSSHLKWDRIIQYYKRKHPKMTTADVFEDVLREWIEKTGLWEVGDNGKESVSHR